jgi:uncharacterized protein (DUF983 family)
MALSSGVMLRRACLRRCPVCGRGHLFRQWVRMAAECPRCGLRFNRLPGHWLGSWFLNVCLAQTVVVLILIIGVAATYPNTPIAPLAVMAGVAAIVVPFLFFPFSRTIWTAIDLAMRPLDFEDGVAPGFELEQEADAMGLRGRERP